MCIKVYMLFPVYRPAYEREKNTMRNLRFAVSAGLLILGTVAANATWYTSEAAFMAAISGPNYTEDFSSFTFGSPLNGSQTIWSAPGANGFGWDATAAGGLYSNNSSLSTNIANTPLVLTFTGLPVYAFGGRISNTDISGNFIPGSASITLSTSETNSINLPNGGEGWLGWVGTSSFAAVSLISTGTTNNWIQLDHAVVAGVPEPASMAVLGIGALAAIARRRRNK
jgi:hypothetical protein